MHIKGESPKYEKLKENAGAELGLFDKGAKII
jgi:hypothetical protein